MRVPRIQIIAPSSVVPQIEFELGLQRLGAQGFDFEVHPQCKKEFRFFAGTDADRAQAFLAAAYSLKSDVLWCARGGYGAARLLPILAAESRKRGKPPAKLLVGFSDATALIEFVQTKWGWSVLHAPMPGLRKFALLGDLEWSSLASWIRGEVPAQPWGVPKLKLNWLTPRPKTDIEAPLIGGNLAVFSTLIGTPYVPRARGKIVFFEDTDEPLYRLDRIVTQLMLSGVLKGARAIVLGNFSNCYDPVASVLVRSPSSQGFERMVTAPKPTELQPLRQKLEPKSTISDIFSELGRDLGAPVAQGLPVGHGPEKFPLPMGGRYRLARSGVFEFKKWEWIF
ncbi:LD-carboxypeptidase [Bdellovibrionota bacterium FG-2]